jgi:hypothetical protein
MIIALALPTRTIAAPPAEMYGGTMVKVPGGPTFWIHDLVRDAFVIVGVTDYPENDTYFVYMRNLDAVYIKWILVGSFKGGSPDSFNMRFNIPEELRGSSHLAIMAQHAITKESGGTGFTNFNEWTGLGTWTSEGITSGSGTWVSGSYIPAGVPYMTILNVVKDSEVTIQTFRFPHNKSFEVRLGKIGTKGIGGVLIGIQDTGENSSFIVTYPIPASLHGEDAISIRLYSPDSGHYAYNWFLNEDGDGGSIIAPSSGTTTTGPTLPAGTYPYFSIQSVVAGSNVTIQGFNFTANDTYTVRMGFMGTKGIGGIVVATVTTNASGQLSNSTFNIPSALANSYQISIRLESNNSPYYAYNWFFNKSFP